MFNFSGGLLAGQHDLQKERQPPSRPVPVTFPSLTPPPPSRTKVPTAWVNSPISGITTHLVSLKKPSDVSLDTLALLNVTFEPQADFETLLPSLSDDERSYVPPASWLDPPVQTEPPSVSVSEPSVKLLCNGRRVPDRNDFYSRAKELVFKNDDAFANLTRKGATEKVPLRLAHFRKFWEGLDNLAYYWDTSLDEYLPPKPDAINNGNETTQKPTSALSNGGSTQENVVEPGPESGPTDGSSNDEEPRKKAKTEAVSNETTSTPFNRMGFGTGRTQIAISSSKALPARSAPPKVPWAMNMPAVSEKPLDLSKGSYKGYRIGNGAEMPDQYRLDCVRAFLEPIAWAFGVTLVPHRRPPVLAVEHVRFPVRMNSVGWRGPTDRVKARQGWMEGPVLGVQCRPDVDFGSKGDLEAESVLDVVRELGGMLLLAQERAREGQVEKRSGEGKWWTSTPRWGGGPGGEVGEATGASDAPSQEVTPKPEEKATSRPRVGSSKDRKRPSPAEIWKQVRAGNPMWDPKIVYEAIGKDKDTDWDEIFMISSLNHHISVVKLRIHRLYVHHLTEGTLPNVSTIDSDWYSPVLQRTRWYDLFSIEDRTEAMRGIWGILAYLMRSQQRNQTNPKSDIEMKGTA